MSDQRVISEVVACRLGVAARDRRGGFHVRQRAVARAAKEASMRPIPEGAEGVFALTVAPEHLANQFKDAALPPVLATPVMIMMMENAALNAIKPTKGLMSPNGTSEKYEC